MDTCQVCPKPLSTGKVITCSGTCGTAYHQTCIGLTKLQFASWSAGVGLYWFCNSCRLNFEPAVYDREKTIMKALRELLIRTDSMDTRLGIYGENLRRINKTIYGKPHQAVQTHQSTFLHDLDQLILDDTAEDPINRSRSCEETSFFEVLDEINCTIAKSAEKFVVGSNKRVQILPSKPSTTPAADKNNNNVPRINGPTPSAQTQQSNSHTAAVISSDPSNTDSRVEDNRSHIDSATEAGGNTRPYLRVATKDQTDNNMLSFYVTPFAPDQNQNELLQHVHDITNVDLTQVKVTKLVPRGKSLDDLTFVSFKVTVPKTTSEVVGDPWYWPEGITVRLFEPNQKNGPATHHQRSS